MLNSNKNAFTLIESLIVLLISTSVLLITAISFRDYQNDMELNLFLKEFERQIILTQSQAIHLGKDCYVYISGDEINFQNKVEGSGRTVIEIPKSVTSKSGPSSFRFIKNSGAPSALSTYKFVTADKTYTYTFQLGGGHYTYTES